MDCSAITETLVECAREAREPQPEIRAHLLVCATCTDRWEGEFLLSSQFQALRAQAGGRRSAYIRRTEVLQRFDALHPKRTVRPWWGLAAAAALLMTVGIGVAVRHTSRASAPLAEEVSEAQNEAQEAGFIAVPFVPPLAPGELVRVVHTELQPAELASLGVNVDPTLSADLPADVLVGADGFPRAVRISDEVSGVAGY
ncbi:MAG TPA: hypothetical protein VNH18_10230 [Bryobacteraceae bacterium]|nr:hypothetical protein [Bryobacteraceae bacterium]